MGRELVEEHFHKNRMVEFSDSQVGYTLETSNEKVNPYSNEWKNK